MSRLDARTEMNWCLYDLAMKAAQDDVHLRDVNRIRRYCEDALPDDDALLEALGQFVAVVFETPQIAADDLMNFLETWRLQHHIEAPSLFCDRQNASRIKRAET